jgi:hypothetical protein
MGVWHGAPSGHQEQKGRGGGQGSGRLVALVTEARSPAPSLAQEFHLELGPSLDGYECDFDPATKAVLNVRVRLGRLGGR